MLYCEIGYTYIHPGVKSSYIHTKILTFLMQNTDIYKRYTLIIIPKIFLKNLAHPPEEQKRHIILIAITWQMSPTPQKLHRTTARIAMNGSLRNIYQQIFTQSLKMFFWYNFLVSIGVKAVHYDPDTRWPEWIHSIFSSFTYNIECELNLNSYVSGAD